MFYYSIKFTLIAMLIWLVYGVVMFFLYRNLVVYNRGKISAKNKTSGILQQIFSGLTKFRMQGAESSAFYLWSKNFGKEWEYNLKYRCCVTVLLAIGAAWIDAEHRIIPDKLTYPVMLLALALSGVFPEARGCASRPEAMLVCLVSGALPGAFLGIFALLGRLLCRREVMGHGDVKFACASGMLFGAAGAFFSLLVGAAAGLFYGVVSCRLRGERIRDRELAFGPFLALGALIWIFFGTAILGLLGGK